MCAVVFHRQGALECSTSAVLSLTPSAIVLVLLLLFAFVWVLQQQTVAFVALFGCLFAKTTTRL